MGVDQSSDEALFRRYMFNALSAVLESVQPFIPQEEEQDDLPPPLPNDVKTRALHTLTYIYKIAPDQLHTLWPDTRQLLLHVAPLMERAGHRYDWLPYLEKGASLAKILNDPPAEMAFTIYIGYVYQLSSAYDDAYEWYAKCLANAQNHSNKTFVARASNCLAYIAKLKRNFDEANKLIEEILRDPYYEKSTEYAHAKFTYGTIQLETGDYEEALQNFLCALKINHQLGDIRRMARCHRGVGTAYQALHDYSEAIQYTQNAIDLFQKLGDKLELAVAEMNLATLWLCQGNSTKARNRYKQILPLLHKLQDKQHLAIIYNNIGYTYHLEDTWQDAVEAYQKSIQLYREFGDIGGLINTLESLGDVYAKSNQIEEAINIYRTASQEITTRADPLIEERYGELIRERLKNLESKRA